MLLSLPRRKKAWIVEASGAFRALSGFVEKWAVVDRDRSGGGTSPQFPNRRLPNGLGGSACSSFQALEASQSLSACVT